MSAFIFSKHGKLFVAETMLVFMQIFPFKSFFMFDLMANSSCIFTMFYKYMLKNRGANMDPCGTPVIISDDQQLYLACILTL